MYVHTYLSMYIHMYLLFSAERLYLSEPESYHYLNQSGCVNDPTINDANDFSKVTHAFGTMKVGSEQLTDLFSVLSSILLIGNIVFKSAAGAQVTDQSGYYYIHTTYICTYVYI